MYDESCVFVDADWGDEEDRRKTSGLAYQLLAYEVFIVSLEVLCEESTEAESGIDYGEVDVNWDVRISAQHPRASCVNQIGHQKARDGIIRPRPKLRTDTLAILPTHQSVSVSDES